MQNEHFTKSTPVWIQRIAEIMAKKKLNAAELSKRSGVSPPHISVIMSGARKNPGVKTIMALEDGLGVRHGALTTPSKKTIV